MDASLPEDGGRSAILKSSSLVGAYMDGRVVNDAGGAVVDGDIDGEDNGVESEEDGAWCLHLDEEDTSLMMVVQPPRGDDDDDDSSLLFHGQHRHHPHKHSRRCRCHCQRGNHSGWTCARDSMSRVAAPQETTPAW